MLKGNEMRIAIIDTLGLCYDGSTLSKRGLGGSESAVIMMSKELVKLGFSVTVFNDCINDDARPGVYDGVTFKYLKEVETDYNFDIAIASRSVGPFAPKELVPQFKWSDRYPDFDRIMKNTRYHVLWMHDTFCDGDQYIEDFLLRGYIHKVFTLSDFHTIYFSTCDHSRKRMFEVDKRFIFQTRNGINPVYNRWVDVRDKDPDLFVYNSSLTKGMMPLVDMIWPRVKKNIPTAKLKIVGGFYRFRPDHGPDEQEKKFYELKAYGESLGIDIEFTGIIKQDKIAELLAKASYMIYPSAFPETYGISTLEALASNVPIITCRFGALEETAIDIASYKMDYSIEPNGLYPWINKDYQVNAFVDMVTNAYHNKYLHQQKMYACNQVKDICGWDSVALQWKQHFYKALGEFLPISDYKKVSEVNHKVRKVFGRRFYNNTEELTEPRNLQQMISIISPVYNAEKYIRKCILSVASQDYDMYNHYVVNDKSTDNTLKVIQETIASLPKHIQTRFHVIDNPVNVGAICNQVTSIRNIPRDVFKDQIVMLLDGDDWLVNDPNIFHKFNNIYSDGAEFTYGSCWSVVDNIPLIAQPYPPYIKQSNLYKEYPFNWNMPYTHLRTFKLSLFDRVSDYQFKDENGNWFKAGGDTAMFYNLIEIADPNKVVCVPDIVYNYNDANPLNDYKVHSDEQNKTAEKICGKGVLTNGFRMMEQPQANVDKFSVVMATMWRCPNTTESLLTSLTQHELVDEIILINNDVERTPDLPILMNKKIRFLNQNTNIGVNPAWNLGVEKSKNDLICIVNDDITFDVKLFDKIQNRLKPNSGVYGLIIGDPKLGQPPTTDGSIDFIEWKKGDCIHCFGQLMFIHKEDWVPILKELVINFGDDWIIHNQLLKRNKIWLIYNIHFFSETSPTVTDKTIPLIARYDFNTEQNIYHAWSATHPIHTIEEPKKEPVVMNTIKKRILIGIPTQKYIESETFKSIFDLEVPDGYETDFQYFYGYNIDQVRNLIAHWAERYDYLFSVDSDIAFPPDTLKRFLSYDKDMVTGLYIQRKPGQEIVEVYRATAKGGLVNVDYSELQDKGLVEVDGCGFGCVLVKSEVIRKIGYPQFAYKSSIHMKDTISEDVDFCMKAKRNGFRIWADTDVVCNHIGNTVFRPVKKEIESKEMKMRNRLRELSNLPLLPTQTFEYMKNMKESQNINPKVIYDIGSCVLHWTKVAKIVWPEAKYYLVESMEHVKFLYDENNIDGYHLGVVGDRDGKQITFYENPMDPGGNSYYKENERYSPQANVLYDKSTELTKTMLTLDTLVKKYGWPKPDLVKMDIQGSELDVLRGMPDTIKSVQNLILEMQRVEYNLGAPLKDDIISYLRSIGFELVANFCDNGPDGDYHFKRI